MSETYSLTVERVIPGSIEEVFDAWLDPASMKQWMKPGPMTLSEVTVDPVVGGKYALMFAGEGQLIPHEGEYREITRPHRLVFTWKSAGAGDTVVTVAFARVADRKTKTYYQGDCRPAIPIADANRITFKTTAEAEKAGYTLSRACS